MRVILFDDLSQRAKLFPLTLTRPIAALRVGILTISEKWEKYLGCQVSYQTEPYLQKKFPVKYDEQNLLINGSLCPNSELIEKINNLSTNEALFAYDTLLAIKLPEELAKKWDCLDLSIYKPIHYKAPITQLVFPEDIFKWNDAEIRKDYTLLTKNRTSKNLSNTNCILGENIFIEEGVSVECSTLNTLEGPIYLGKNSQIWEGCNIRGSFALCEHAQVKMGAKIYGMTTIGPHSRVGGEINNAVIFGYTSKGHDGYLGNSVLGEWCNLGANTNTSNLKNNYSEVSLWDYNKMYFRKTGLQFCGLIMADHAKCSINTMFNTGTVVGVGANIFGAGFPKNFVPDFAWGGAGGFETHQLTKLFETAEKVFARRNKSFDVTEKDILIKVFELTETARII